MFSPGTEVLVDTIGHPDNYQFDEPGVVVHASETQARLTVRLHRTDQVEMFSLDRIVPA